MWFFLAASVLFPLINSGWSDPGPLPESLLDPPPSPCRLSESRIREQASYYRSVLDPVIRSRIALTLRRANEPAALPVLRALLKEERDIRLQADLIASYRYLAEELGDVSGIDADFPAPYLLSESAVVRREAALILIQTGTGLPEIAAMLEKNTSPFLTETVLSRLADLSLRLPAETTAALAASADTRIRCCALKYLARISEKPDGEALLADAAARAEKEKDLSALHALTAGLAANPAKKCPALLKKLVLSDLLPATARLEAASLMSAADPGRVDLLLALLDDPSPSVRAAAARSLSGAKPSGKWRESLGKRLRDEARAVREAAAGALAAQAEPTLSETILAASGDRDSRSPLLTVICASGNKKYAAIVAEILKKARAEKDPALVRQAVETLAVLRAESMAPLVLDLAADRDGSVRKAVAVSLRVFPGSAATSALKKLVRDPLDDVAIAAMETIRVLNETSLAKDLAEAVGKFKRSSRFRAYACRALGKMTDSLDAKGISTLRKLILRKCIVVPQEPPAYDDPLPRALALYLLLEGSRAGNQKCREAFSEVVESLKNPSVKEKEDGFCDGLMAEYFRQILLMSDGKEAVPEPVPDMEPELFIYGNHDKKK